jgi:hypothetical protein
MAERNEGRKRTLAASRVSGARRRSAGTGGAESEERGLARSSGAATLRPVPSDLTDACCRCCWVPAKPNISLRVFSRSRRRREATSSGWLRPVFPECAWCRYWTVAQGAEGRVIGHSAMGMGQTIWAFTVVLATQIFRSAFSQSGSLSPEKKVASMHNVQLVWRKFKNILF